MNKEKEYIDKLNKKFVIPLNFINPEMFPGDWIRYKQAIEMLEKIDLKLNSNSNVLDLGSPLPFITYYTYLKYNNNVCCWDININTEYNIEKVSGKNFNVCRDNLDLQIWDFISFTEVLEHLPCNMYLIREKVISSLKDGKYLLISYPLGGKNADTKNYGKDLMDKNWDTTHNHLREFTSDLAMTFISNLKIVDVKKVVPPSYKAGSIQILYKKEFV